MSTPPIKSIVLGMLCVLFAALLTACGSGQAERESERGHGALSLGLTSTTNGHTYQLRNAVFSVTGASPQTVESEANPAADSFTLVLPVGPHAVTLEPGWFLTREDANGWVTVSAELSSPATVGFEIELGQATPVAFRFSTDGRIVTVGGEGTLEIPIEVTETGGDGGVTFGSEVVDVGNVMPGRIAAQGIGIRNDTGSEIFGSLTFETLEPGEINAALAGTSYDPGLAVSDTSLWLDMGGFGTGPIGATTLLVWCRPNLPVGQVSVVRVNFDPRTFDGGREFHVEAILIVRSATEDEVPVRARDDSFAVPADTTTILNPFANDESASGVPLILAGLSADIFGGEIYLDVGTFGPVGEDPQAIRYIPRPGFSGPATFYYAAAAGYINGRYDYAKVTLQVGSP